MDVHKFSRSNILGGEWKFEYDSSSGLLSKATDPDNHINTWNYTLLTNPRYLAEGPNYLNKMTLLSASTDGKGAPTTYAYNGDGFLSGVADSVGQIQITDWDLFGQPKTVLGPRTGYQRQLEYKDTGRVK